jgi:2-oxoisovalerate dehydrogenase E1 component
MIQKNNDEEDFILEPHNVEILEKQVNQINKYFKSSIQEDDKTIIIGEDIADPYGGAFKVTKGISNKFKDNVISTPISEAGIVGMGIGMALLGYKPFVEIMFGDFISYSFDQIISNASKFYNMYNKQVSVPLTIRTPMGGGRGYGPTHSQSIEKIFNGINNLQIVALNTLIDASEIYRASKCRNHTTISIENKLDYGRLENKIPERFNYKFFKTTADFPTIIGLPKNKKQKLSIITYGGASHVVFESIESIFYEFELIPNIIILTKLYPLPLKTIATLLDDSKYIITVEEGNVEGGFGSEIISSLVELDSFDNKSYCRIGSRNIPIPATKILEEQVLVNTKIIIDKLKDIL